MTLQLLPAIELVQLETVDIDPVNVSRLRWSVEMTIRHRTYIDSDPPRHVTNLRQICVVYKHVGTASRTELMGHPLLTILVLLQLVFTFNLEVVFPHIHV